ncbi:MAG: DUF3791 domain-containing protein [Clostridia bacterium]|nr:DUF3791 domain-containing protein [Clostridia bacterium]
MTRQEEKDLNFLVYCIEIYKQSHNLTGKEVIALFQNYGVTDYILRFAESLHTTGERYILADINDYLEARGAMLPN